MKASKFYTLGDIITLSLGWLICLVGNSIDCPELYLVACGIFIGGLVKIIFD